MNDSPNIARIAALIGDPARALMLQALMSGRALTVSELGATAGVAKATASSHLAQLVAGGLVTTQAQGRHKYVTLASPAVARAIEGLMVLAAGHGAPAPGKPPRTGPRIGPRDPALRQARRCYNHLAGARGVQAYDSLRAQGALAVTAAGMDLTPKGHLLLASLGLDPADLAPGAPPLCRECLDWSERRPHLAGRVGRALLTHILEKKWANPVKDSRALIFTPNGLRAFDRAFPPVSTAFTLDAPAARP